MKTVQTFPWQFELCMLSNKSTYSIRFISLKKSEKKHQVFLNFWRGVYVQDQIDLKH